MPIIPGLKVLRSQTQLRSIPKTFHVDLPNDLVDEVVKNPQHVEAIGKNWAQKQAQELLDAGYKNLHFYIMNDTQTVIEIVRTFQK